MEGASWGDVLPVETGLRVAPDALGGGQGGAGETQVGLWDPSRRRVYVACVS